MVLYSENSSRRALSRLEDAVVKAASIALDKNDKEIYSALLEHILKIIHISNYASENESFRANIDNLFSLFVIALRESSISSVTNSLYSNTIVRIATTLRGTTQVLGILYNSDTDEKESILHRYAMCYQVFLRVLYLLVSQSDWMSFEIVFKELITNSPELPLKSRPLDMDLLGKETLSPEEKDVIIKTNAKKRQPIEWWLNSRLSIVYWSIVLYENNKIDASRLNNIWELCKEAGSSWLHNSIDNISTVVYSNNYLEIDHWDYTERQSGKAYFRLSKFDWFRRGFIVDLIRTNNLSSLNATECTDNTKHLLSKMIKDLEDIDSENEKWSNLFNLTNDELRSRVSKCKKIVNELLTKIDISNARDIVKKTIDQNKVAAFKNEIFRIWDERAFIYKLFVENNCPTIETSEFPFSSSAGDSHNMLDVKTHFTDSDDHTQIVGLNQHGYWLCDLDEWLFYQKIVRIKRILQTTNSVIDALEMGLAEVSKHFTPTLIIMHSQLSADKSLFMSQNFTPSWEIPENKTGSLEYSLYNNIKVYLTYNDLVRDKIIVCNLKEGFSITKSTKFHDGTVDFDVKEIDDTMAESIYAKQSDQWLKDEHGNILEKEDAMIRIKNGLIFYARLHHEYNITNDKAFCVVEIVH